MDLNSLPWGKLSMANAVILASGRGTNFQAIAERLKSSNHGISALICDRKEAGCYARAEALSIPYYHVSYFGRNKEEAEEEILGIIGKKRADLIILAGFMRLISPLLIDKSACPVINIHPSLLPRYPGTRGIEESFNSRDSKLGITIHRVDYGMDTGPVIKQISFERTGNETKDEIEDKIHKLEYEWYPKEVLAILNGLKVRHSGQ